MTADAPSVSESLGQFVVRSSWNDVPATLRHETKRAVLNVVGCALGAALDPAIETFACAFAVVAGQGAATLIGRAERFDVGTAAFINAAAANLLDYDDTHLDTVIHPTAPVAAAALALGEQC